MGNLRAWRTLLVFMSVTPCLMHDSRSRKGTVFVPKHGKKTCKGTLQAQLRHVFNIAKAHFRHSLGTVLARFRHKYSTLGTFLKIFVTRLAKKNKLGTNYKNQIKHDTVRSIESVSFEPRRKLGKLFKVFFDSPCLLRG